MLVDDEPVKNRIFHQLFGWGQVIGHVDGKVLVKFWEFTQIMELSRSSLTNDANDLKG